MSTKEQRERIELLQGVGAIARILMPAGQEGELWAFGIGRFAAASA
jgi:hypothetical protein